MRIVWDGGSMFVSRDLVSGQVIIKQGVREVSLPADQVEFLVRAVAFEHALIEAAKGPSHRPKLRERTKRA